MTVCDTGGGVKIIKNSVTYFMDGPQFRVSGGSEFQSRELMTEKALLPSDDRTYGMEKPSESEDFVETECDGNERLLQRYVGC